MQILRGLVTSTEEYPTPTPQHRKPCAQSFKKPNESERAGVKMSASTATRKEHIAQSHCAASIAARVWCWAANGGKETELCFQEELLEKQCLSHIYCPKSAAAFYGDKDADTRSKAVCSLWAESFAWPDDASHLAARQRVQTSPSMQAKCRAVALDLTKCMATARHYAGYAGGAGS